MRKTFSLLLLAAVLALPAEAKVTRYLTGNAADVVVSLAGPAHDFGGGGTDVDAALQWIIDQVRGCTSCSTKVDVVILRSSGSNGYNDYIYAMNGVDSVETLVITSAQGLQHRGRRDHGQERRGGLLRRRRPVRLRQILQGHEGGDGRRIGLCPGRRRRRHQRRPRHPGRLHLRRLQRQRRLGDALANPYHRTVTFTYDFFHWANLGGTITDSHFVTRDRMGRTLAFLARQIKDGKAASALSIAVEEGTSVEVDSNGLATVVGAGPAYFMLADHAPEICAAGVPLTYSNFKIWKVTAGGTFDLRNRPTAGYYLRSVSNGVISSESVLSAATAGQGL